MMDPSPRETGLDLAIRAVLARDALVTAEGRAAGLVTRWVPGVGYVMHAERRLRRNSQPNENNERRQAA